jgi:hypothetical protein
VFVQVVTTAAAGASPGWAINRRRPVIMGLLKRQADATQMAAEGITPQAAATVPSQPPQQQQQHAVLLVPKSDVTLQAMLDSACWSLTQPKGTTLEGYKSQL